MSGSSIRVAGERVLERAVKEMRTKDGWVYFGPLGRVKASELRRKGIPLGIRPGWRRFSEFTLLLMRSSALTVMRKALEIEKLLEERKNEIPVDVYRELLLAASKIKFEGRLLLKDIDERLFNIQYALYDIL
jgi:hypothetical protein